MIARWIVVARLASIASLLQAAGMPSVSAEAAGAVVQGNNKVAIYVFPSAAIDETRAPWPYAYPAYPAAHPAFPAVPMYPAFGVPTPYVPLGSPYPPPPVEIRGIELKPGGRLVIAVEPKDADVYVDGMRLAVRGEHGFEIGLLAGRHRVDVRRGGMSPWSQDVDVPAGGGLLINVGLEAEK
jgi:hypothetical protein